MIKQRTQLLLLADEVCVDVFVGAAKLPGVFQNELFVQSRDDAAVPERWSWSFEEKQFGAELGQARVDGRYVRPSDGAGPDAVREVQRIKNGESPRAIVFLNARVKPFELRDDAVEVREILSDGHSAPIFRLGERTESVRLRKVKHRANFSRSACRHVAAQKNVNERGLPNPGSAFDDEDLAGLHSALSLSPWVPFRVRQSSNGRR